MSKQYIYNPIIPGFNPDPSIVRVNGDYYIATSTFEWFPGVQIHHSKDLIQWELITRPLDRVSQLDMKDTPDSCGIWAPSLSYCNDIFYLVYTNVKSIKGMWRDMYNYLVTAENIRGPWSEPIYLNSIGHDPSLFHDDDGRKWLLNVEWEYINGKNIFNGIVLQEYDPEKKTLIGPKYNIFKGTKAGFTEGPHLYKRNGFYYLLTAEGGTWYNHCVTVARSRHILGPYEVHPENPILTSKHNKKLILQKAGHGDLVETQNREWYLVHLCARPITRFRRCVMGRETAIQKVIWKDDWPYIDSPNKTPSIKVEVPQLTEFKIPSTPTRIDFDENKLDINFQFLRIPLDVNILSLKERKGFLRLRGCESLSSLNLQSLVARRQQSFYYVTETVLEFFPTSTRHMAGLVIYYNTENYYYLAFSFNEFSGKNLRIITCNKGKIKESTGMGIPLDDNIYRVGLRIVVNKEKGQFYYSLDEINWRKIGPTLDMSKLSDDFIGGKAFTGTFIGICCQDLSGDGKYADFDYFEYKELDSKSIKNFDKE